MIHVPATANTSTILVFHISTPGNNTTDQLSDNKIGETKTMATKVSGHLLYVNFINNVRCVTQIVSTHVCLDIFSVARRVAMSKVQTYLRS